MELVFKAILLALTAGLAAAALQKSAPAIPLLLGMAAGAGILLLAMELAAPIVAFLRRARQSVSVSGVYLSPLLKCLGIAVLERLGAALCKDAGQAAAAEAIALAGTTAALYAALPLLEEFLSLLEKLL